MKKLGFVSVSVFVLALALSGAAAAQDEQDDDLPDPDDFGGDEVEMPADDAPLGVSSGDAPEGAEENPDDPKTIGSTPADAAVAKRAAPAGPYPIQRTLRPITLPRGMSEIAFEAPVFVDPFNASGLLRADYGITDQIQVGLRYGAGTFGTVADGIDSEFHVGRTVAVEGFYRFTRNISAQLEVPVHIDPIAVAITVGVPMEFNVTDALRLFVGEDLLTITVHEFTPVVDNAAFDDLQSDLVAIGAQTSDGAIRVKGGAIYQQSDKLAVQGELGYIAEDFSGEDPQLLMQLTVMHSTSNKVDVGATVGALDLNELTDTFGLRVFAALRI